MQRNKTISLLLFLSLVGCSTTTVPLNTKENFSVLSKKNTTINPDASGPPPSTYKPSAPDDSKGVLLNNDLRDKEKASFDYLPPEDTVAVDGKITVIFKNEAKVRVNKSDEKIYSLSNIDLSSLESLLKKNGLTHSIDLGNYSPNNDDQLDSMQRNYLQENKVDIPHLRSIHYYKISKKADSKSLCKEIMSLPYVRLAYPTPKLVKTTETLLSNTPYEQLTPNPTPDYYTRNNISKKDYTYWFHEHEAFKGKTYYKNNTYEKPKLAIIDTGFDANSPEIDLVSGYNIYDPWFGSPVVNSNCPNNNCIHSTDNISHGNVVSYVAAARNDNYDAYINSYGEGIAEGAKILPFNTDLDTTSINIALSYAQNDLSVDAINISVANVDIFGNESPLSFDSAINTSISYAVQSWNLGYGKPVVITAGNSYKALNPPNNYSSDAIVVGGTMPYTVTTVNAAGVPTPTFNIISLGLYEADKPSCSSPLAIIFSFSKFLKKYILFINNKPSFKNESTYFSSINLISSLFIS